MGKHSRSWKNFVGTDEFKERMSGTYKSLEERWKESESLRLRRGRGPVQYVGIEGYKLLNQVIREFYEKKFA